MFAKFRQIFGENLRTKFVPLNSNFQMKWQSSKICQKFDNFLPTFRKRAPNHRRPHFYPPATPKVGENGMTQHFFGGRGPKIPNVTGPLQIDREYFSAHFGKKK